MDYQTIATTTTPIRPPSVAADAHLPIASAAISGGLVATTAAAAAAGLAILTGSDLARLAPIIGLGWLLTALGVTTYDWFRQRAAAQDAIWATETRQNEDLDGDHQIGRPHGMIVSADPAPDPVAAMQEKTAAMLDAIWATGSTTHSTIRARCGLDRDDYNEIRDQLIAAGIAAWIGAGRSHGWQPAPGLDLPTAQRIAEKKIVWLPAPTPRPLSAPKGAK